MTLSAFPDAMPLQGLGGGLLIGLAAAIMLLGSGRIAGVSGMAARAFRIAKTDTPVVVASVFILGLPLGAFLLEGIAGPVQADFPDSAILLIVAGAFVGFGTRMGSGCTSGHGVCGMSRLSPRSLIATATFIVAGLITVAIMNAAGVVL